MKTDISTIFRNLKYDTISFRTLMAEVGTRINFTGGSVRYDIYSAHYIFEQTYVHVRGITIKRSVNWIVMIAMQ